MYLLCIDLQGSAYAAVTVMTLLRKVVQCTKLHAAAMAIWHVSETDHRHQAKTNVSLRSQYVACLLGVILPA